MKFLALFLILLIASVGYGQDSQFWGRDGRDITWNVATYFNANETDFFGSDPTYLDTTGGISTFYTDLIRTNGDGYEGIFHFTFSLDSIAGMDDIDSVAIHMRRYLDSNLHPVDYWDDWYEIVAGATTKTVYEYQIADSTWWRPSNGIQLKIVVTDANLDTLSIPNVGLYIR